MTNPTLERAARAAGEVAANMESDVRHVLSERALEDVARAVLMAVRDCREEKIERAAWAKVQPYHDLTKYERTALIPGDLFRLALPAMIDAILNEKNDG